jgi:hypothetical protein
MQPRFGGRIMGRPAAYSADFSRWRERFRRELSAEAGDAFAVEAMDELDAEVSWYGENLARDRKLYESTIPGMVLARRKVRQRG